MTDRQALLAAIIAEPDEDMPRLAYADWLDEQGDTYFSDSAALIRLQIAYARAERYSSEWLELAGRHAPLFEKRKQIWEPTWNSRLGYAAYRRGFLEAEQFKPTSKTFATNFDRLFATEPLRALHFLDLGNAGGAALETIVFHPALARIETLDLANNNPDAALPLLAAVAPRMPRLRALGLRRLGLTAGSAADELASVSIPGLAALDLGYNVLFDADDNDRRPESLFHSPTLAGVRWLDVQGTAMNPAAVHALAHSPVVRGLRYLDVGCPASYVSNHPTFGAAGAVALADGPSVRGVEFLHLSGQRIGDHGVAALARSPLLASVRELNLSYNDIGDEGAIALAECRHAAGLRKLDLEGNPIGPAGAEALIASPHLAGLRILNLTQHPPGLPPEVMDRLRERFPDKPPALHGPTWYQFFEPIP
jgi:uncharacterized protein (TIGR02996 family)